MRSTNFGPLVTLKLEGGGKVDTTRRALLGLLGKQQPSPLATVSNPPVQITPQPAASPLATVVERAVQTPMSRREFMEKTGKTVASQALQDVAGGLGVQSIAKMAAKTAIPSRPTTEIAEEIAKYANDVAQDQGAVSKVLSIVLGTPMEEYTFYSRNPNYDALSEIYSSGDPKAMSEAAKAIGLDIEGISRATGLSVKDITKVVKDDYEVLQKLSETAGSRTFMEGILEDGRPKEAYRSTSLVDIDEAEVDKIIKKVVKEYGKDADPQDIISEVSDRVRNKFFETERGHGGKDPLYGALYKNVLDDSVLDDVYRQMTDDDYLDIGGRVNEYLGND
jgi:hypothetical protein